MAQIDKDQSILTPFLAARQKEVVDIMELLFSQEEVWEMSLQEATRKAAREAKQEGLQEGLQKGERNRDTLYGELLRRLEPLGRAGDLLAATADKAKLASLAQEFGLEM